MTVSPHIVSLPNDILIPQVRQLIDEGKSVTIPIRGYSMRPFLDDRRDKVVIRMAKEGELRPGLPILAEIAPHVYALHRIISIDGNGCIIMRGDGNVRGTETCTVENVIGVAEAFYRKGRNRPDTVTGRKWRIYSALWPSSPLLRRILLGLHRHLLLTHHPSTPPNED